MKTVIYIDVLFIINFFITFLVIMVSSKFMKTSVFVVRALLSATFGGFYSFVILLDEIPFFVSVSGKLLCAGIIVLISFKFKTISFFLKSLVVFFFTNLLFLGIIIGFWMIFKPSGFYVNNANVYLGVSAKTLIFSAGGAYLISSLVLRIYNRVVSSNQIYSITVFVEKREKKILAFSDSGNNLKEPFSNFPVIVVDKDLLGDFGKNKGTRLIPFETINSNGLLEGFKPDRVEVSFNGKTKIINDVYVARSSGNFRGKNFSAIFNPKILNE